MCQCCTRSLYGLQEIGLITNWKIGNGEDHIEYAVRRYRRYLENKGFRPTTIAVYAENVCRYLRFAGTDRPSDKALKSFCEKPV